MLSAAGPAGRIGLTAIGGSREEAARLYERAAAVLVEAAADAARSYGRGRAARPYAAATAATAGFGVPS